MEKSPKKTVYFGFSIGERNILKISNTFPDWGSLVTGCPKEKFSLVVPISHCTWPTHRVFRQNLLQRFSIFKIIRLAANQQRHKVIFELASVSVPQNEFTIEYQFGPSLENSQSLTATIVRESLERVIRTPPFRKGTESLIKMVEGRSDYISFGSIAEFRHGSFVFSRMTKGEKPTTKKKILLPSHVSRNILIDNTFSEKYSELSANIPQLVLQKNQILLTSTGIYEGSQIASITVDELKDTVLSQHIIVATLKLPVDENFIFGVVGFLNSDLVIKYLLATSPDSRAGSLNLSELAALRIPTFKSDFLADCKREILALHEATKKQEAAKLRLKSFF